MVQPNEVHILSLGAGVQSSTMALMAACGEITPMPTAAIFADTQAEPKTVYVWLDWLEKQLPFPVHRVTAGDLAEASTRLRVSKKSGLPYLGHTVPAYTINADGSKGHNFRICTDKHKLAVLRKETHRIRAGRPVIMWIGISRDEVQRMKDSNHKAITHRWPLVDANMTRQQCKDWMTAHGFPEPPRSACSFCPYHSNKEWMRLKKHEPEAFKQAVEYELRLQAATKQIPRMTGVPYLHNSRVPLDQVDLDDSAKKTHPDLFGNDCSGMCGV
jgi:hypothetical protein